jgi:hypothetical protein
LDTELLLLLEGTRLNRAESEVETLKTLKTTPMEETCRRHFHEERSFVGQIVA